MAQTAEEIKAYQKEYYQRPKVKEKMRNYMRKYMTDYNKRPDVQEKLKAYRRLPHVRAKNREACRKHRARKRLEALKRKKK